MNRVLVWKIYEFFLVNILPQAFSMLKGPLKNIFYLSSFLEPDNTEDNKTCVFFSETAPVAPRKMVPCDHRACYYCSIDNSVETCPKCSASVEKWISLGK